MLSLFPGIVRLGLLIFASPYRWRRDLTILGMISVCVIRWWQDRLTHKQWSSDLR